jgi:hypothetical protein
VTSILEAIVGPNQAMKHEICKDDGYVRAQSLQDLSYGSLKFIYSERGNPTSFSHELVSRAPDIRSHPPIPGFIVARGIRHSRFWVSLAPSTRVLPFLRPCSAIVAQD